MILAATGPRKHEHTSEENDQYGAYDESAADQAAGTFSHEVFFCHLDGPFSDWLTYRTGNSKRSAWFRYWAKCR
jgi:hypothetical protein